MNIFNYKSKFKVAAKVKIIEGKYKDKEGEVECVYPPGLMANEEIIKVSFSPFSSGQFKTTEIEVL